MLQHTQTAKPTTGMSVTDAVRRGCSDVGIHFNDKIAALVEHYLGTAPPELGENEVAELALRGVVAEQENGWPQLCHR